jgi:hypothetical protein
MLISLSYGFKIKPHIGVNHVENACGEHALESFQGLT